MCEKVSFLSFRNSGGNNPTQRSKKCYKAIVKIKLVNWKRVMLSLLLLIQIIFLFFPTQIQNLFSNMLRDSALWFLKVNEIQCCENSLRLHIVLHNDNIVHRTFAERTLLKPKFVHDPKPCFFFPGFSNLFFCNWRITVHAVFSCAVTKKGKPE